MARIDWVEQRLQNWARWRLGGMGSLGYSGVDLTACIGGDRPDDAGPSIPTIDCEASETEDAVGRLPGELKATVLQVYLAAGGMAAHVRKLVCTRATIDQRVWRAQRLLAEHFMAQQDRQRVERERVEALLKAARPGRGEF